MGAKVLRVCVCADEDSDCKLNQAQKSYLEFKLKNIQFRESSELTLKSLLEDPKVRFGAVTNGSTRYLLKVILTCNITYIFAPNQSIIILKFAKMFEYVASCSPRISKICVSFEPQFVQTFFN